MKNSRYDCDLFGFSIPLYGENKVCPTILVIIDFTNPRITSVVLTSVE